MAQTRPALYQQGCHSHFHHRLLLSLPLLFLLLLLLLLPLGPVQAADGKDPKDPERPVPRQVTLRYLKRTLYALEDALGFFYSQRAHVNLDGIIGTRIVEGTLKVLLSNLRARGQLFLLPVDIATDIQSIHDLAKRVSDEAQPFVARNEPRYYGRIWPTISAGMWELDYSTRNLSTTAPTWTYEDVEDMRERESDDCLTELFGTSKKTNQSCVISDHCWVAMTKKGYHLYSLTHQIFYLQLGEQWGCMGKMEEMIASHSQPPLRELQDMYCTNILSEAQSLVVQGYPVNRRDLFMEQAGLCGLNGYWEFFRYTWLEQILSWQNKEVGCYQNVNWPHYLKHKHFRKNKIEGLGRNETESPGKNETEKSPGKNETEKSPGKNETESPGTNKTERPRANELRREKRAERRLHNGCLSHMTTLASGVLGLYVRFLTEDLIDAFADLNVYQLYW